MKAFVLFRKVLISSMKAISSRSNRTPSDKRGQTPHNAQVRGLSEANLPVAVEIEAASYPEDEAASPENMRFRRANAGDFFLEATLKTSVSVGGWKRNTNLLVSQVIQSARGIRDAIRALNVYCTTESWGS